MLQEHRGERNEPAWLLSTFEKVCEITGLNQGEAEKRLEKNAKMLFSVL